MTNEEFIESIRLQGEEWREIPSMEGFYMASNFGRIVSLGRFVNVMNGSVKWNNPRILKQNIYGKYKRFLQKFISLTDIFLPYCKVYKHNPNKFFTSKKIAAHNTKM